MWVRGEERRGEENLTQRRKDAEAQKGKSKRRGRIIL
jgi:hypothetical protein